MKNTTSTPEIDSNISNISTSQLNLSTSQWAALILAQRAAKVAAKVANYKNNKINSSSSSAFRKAVVTQAPTPVKNGVEIWGKSIMSPIPATSNKPALFVPSNYGILSREDALSLVTSTGKDDQGQVIYFIRETEVQIRKAREVSEPNTYDLDSFPAVYQNNKENKINPLAWGMQGRKSARRLFRFFGLKPMVRASLYARRGMASKVGIRPMTDRNGFNATQRQLRDQQSGEKRKNGWLAGNHITVKE